MKKRMYSNQYNHYCEKCAGWKLHTRGPKYYTCTVCGTKTERGLTLPAPDKGDSPAPGNLSTLEGGSTAEHEPTPAPCG